MSEKKYKKNAGTVVAYHRYVQGIIGERLNSPSLGPGYVPCKIATVLLPLGIVFLTIGLFVILLRPHHLYLIGVWPRFLGPFFVVLFIVCFGGFIFFYDMATTRSNKYRRKLRFQPYGQYGTKVIHESHIEREELIKGYKSGTAPHKSHRPRHGYPGRRGANNEGYEGSEDRRRERPRHTEGRRPEGPRRTDGPRPYNDHPYSDHPPPKYSERRDERRPDDRRPDDRRPDDRRERRPDPQSKPQYDRQQKPRDEKPRYDDRRDDRTRSDRPPPPVADKPRATEHHGRPYPELEERRPPLESQPKPRDEYAEVDRGSSGGRRGGRYANQEDRRRDPRTSVTRYESQPDKFYDEVPREFEEPAEEHHVVSRRPVESAPRYSERNIDDEAGPIIAPGRAQPRYEVQFDTDTQDSAV